MRGDTPCLGALIYVQADDAIPLMGGKHSVANMVKAGIARADKNTSAPNQPQLLNWVRMLTGRTRSGRGEREGLGRTMLCSNGPGGTPRPS